MLTASLFFHKACRWAKVRWKKVSSQMAFRLAAAAAVLTVFAFVLPGAGAEISSDEAEVRQRQEQAYQVAGELLETNVQKKTEIKEQIDIQAEAAKSAFLEREQESGHGPHTAIERRLEEDEEEPETEQVSTMAISEQDYQVLLKIVEAEAGICDEKGRILVANVILNRVKSGQFPDTVTGVVYQPSQFSPVSTGAIDRVQVTEKTKESVDRALAGEDYSQGALFFMNRSKSRRHAVTWFDSRLTYLFEHGGHEFFR